MAGYTNPYARALMANPKYSRGYAMYQQGSSTAPVNHWAEGLARLGQGLIGGWQMSKAEKEEDEKQKERARKLAAAMDRYNAGDTAGATTILASLGDTEGQAWSLAMEGSRAKREDTRTEQQRAYDRERDERNFAQRRQLAQEARAAQGQGLSWQSAGDRLVGLSRDGKIVAEIPIGAKPGAEGLPKFSNQATYTIDKDGNPVIVQLNDRGEAVQTKLPPGLVPAPNMKPLDVGTGYAPFDPRTGKAGAPIQKDIAGAEEQKVLGATAGQRVAEAPKAKAALDNAFMGFDRMAAEAKAILDSSALPDITGLPGMIPNRPGGEAASLKARVETLKSQIGFSVLQAMRESSKTGGALGAVSEREGGWLQNNLAALDPNMSPEAFRASLKQIIDWTTRSKALLGSAYEQTYTGLTPGNATGGNGPPVAPSVDDLLNKYK